MVAHVIEQTNTTGATVSEFQGYSFEYASVGLPSLEEEEIKNNLFKWNLSSTFNAVSFRMNEVYDHSDIKQYMNDFFHDRTVQYYLSRHLQMYFGKDCTPVFNELIVSSTGTGILTDRLSEEKIVGPTGYIMGRIMEEYEGIELHDKLRESLFMQESELWDVYTPSVRKELLFHIFKTFVLGGRTNQYDESITPYIDISKKVYKDLISVKKNKEGQLDIKSYAYEVTGLGKNSSAFPDDSPGNTCLVVLDPLSRRVIVLHNYWKKNEWW